MTTTNSYTARYWERRADEIERRRNRAVKMAAAILTAVGIAIVAACIIALVSQFRATAQAEAEMNAAHAVRVMIAGGR